MVPNSVINKDLGLSRWCILHAYRGSIAHGMYIPSHEKESVDDKDTIAICVPDIEYYAGLKQYGSRGAKEIFQDEWDIIIYEARKAISLLEKGNPNILSLLWLPENRYIQRTAAGEYLIRHRNLFVGRHVYMSFVGYAKSQFVKMERGIFRGYMGERRKELVKKYGYDCKAASHMIRLLRMGIEFLRDGELIVDRGNYDAAELLSIKKGEWSLERVKDEATKLLTRAENAYDNSTLPAKPNHDDISALCAEVVMSAVTSSRK